MSKEVICVEFCLFWSNFPLCKTFFSDYFKPLTVSE